METQIFTRPVIDLREVEPAGQLTDEARSNREREMLAQARDARHSKWRQFCRADSVPQESVGIELVRALEGFGETMAFAHADAHKPPARDYESVPANRPSSPAHEVFALLEPERFTDNALGDPFCIVRVVKAFQFRLKPGYPLRMVREHLQDPMQQTRYVAA